MHYFRGVPKSFLIVQTAFIGDVVLATALAEKLYGHHSDATIDFLVRKGNEGLFKGHPFVRNVWVWDKKGGKLPSLIGIWLRVRRMRYDAVVNVQRYLMTGLFTAFSGARQSIGFDANPASLLFDLRIPHGNTAGAPPSHEVERNQRLIAHLTEAWPSRPRLYPSKADFDKVRPYRSHAYVCIAPASVWETKQYPAGKWVTLMDSLPKGLSVCLIGGPGDRALCDVITSSCEVERPIHNLAGNLSLLESAALQAGALMNYVNDSAPMHFASAMNAPVTAVYCSTVPSFGYGPLSDVSHIVETDVPLDCRPCGIHGRKTCPKEHFRCAMTIRDERLLECLPLSKRGGSV
jgi:heptosyltransferase-2